jgi:ABC-2 type transport system ATP-binding protein
MLEAQQLTKYSSAARAVRDISFCIQPGEVLGCLGPNGSGKSTTAKMLTSLLEPTHGEVLYGGTRIRDNLAGYKKLVGYVPEEPNLYPCLSRLEYLQLVGNLEAESEMRICDGNFLKGRHLGWAREGGAAILTTVWKSLREVS